MTINALSTFPRVYRRIVERRLARTLGAWLLCLALVLGLIVLMVAGSCVFTNRCHTLQDHLEQLYHSLPPRLQFAVQACGVLLVLAVRVAVDFCIHANDKWPCVVLYQDRIEVATRRRVSGLARGDIVGYETDPRSGAIVAVLGHDGARLNLPEKLACDAEFFDWFSGFLAQSI